MATSLARGERERLPKRRESFTYELELNNHKVYVTLGLYEDKRVGEIFLAVSKHGSMLRTALSTWAVAISKALQFGMPLPEAIHTFRAVRCEEGFIHCRDIPEIHKKKALSLWDAVMLLVETETDEQGRLKPSPSTSEPTSATPATTETKP
jgi:hypothetical protein